MSSGFEVLVTNAVRHGGAATNRPLQGLFLVELPAGLTA
jgi:hypothetical protein